jgi:hypothetical protein
VSEPTVRVLPGDAERMALAIDDPPARGQRRGGGDRRGF